MFAVAFTVCWNNKLFLLVDQRGHWTVRSMELILSDTHMLQILPFTVQPKLMVLQQSTVKLRIEAGSRINAGSRMQAWGQDNLYW